MSQEVRPWAIPQVEPRPLETGDPRAVGPFRIRGRLGSGGMGAVYLGTGRRGQQVAVKVIRGDQLHDGEFRARFRREVRAASGVRSPFLANLVDADPDAAQPWLATEYVPGPTLARALAEQRTLPQPAVMALVGGLAEALAAIHHAGLVHRDVKPANVILGPEGPCLIDLGVVAVQDATRVTMTGQAVGTPRYMAPEQAMGHRTTPATDVWALGALAYHAATGRHLFDGEHVAVVLHRTATEAPSYRDCPDYLRSFLDACLVRDPALRPSMDEIVRQVSGLWDRPAASSAALTMPVPGPRRAEPAAPPRARRRRPRARYVVGGGIAAGLLVAVGLAVPSLVDATGEAAGDEPSPTTSASVTPDAPPAPDGTAERPWKLGAVKRLADDSCWRASVEKVEGRVVTLALSCDETGTPTWGYPEPSRYLAIRMVDAERRVRAVTPQEDALPEIETFWTYGTLPDTATVRLKVTLPKDARATRVGIFNKTYQYGWYWDVAR